MSIHLGTIIDVIIGTTLYRQGNYALDKYLSNQKQIQQNYPASRLVLATCERDYVKELESHIKLQNLKGTVILYEVAKPDYARSRLWNIACGREAIRRHMLFQTSASYLLFADADMTYDPSLIAIMKQEIAGCDAVFSGYPLKQYGTGLAGFGCTLLTRKTLEKISIKCHEFKNGDVIFEDNMLEFDLFRSGCRLKKGFFLAIEHHLPGGETLRIFPQPVGIFQKITNWDFIRYVLFRMSLLLKRNIPWKLKIILWRFSRKAG